MAEDILDTAIGLIFLIVARDYLASYGLEIASHDDLVVGHRPTSCARVCIPAIGARRILIRRADHPVNLFLRCGHSVHCLLIPQLFKLLVNIGLIAWLEKSRSSRRQIRRVLRL